MKLLAKILGTIVGFVLYPFFWLLEWVLLFIAAIEDEVSICRDCAVEMWTKEKEEK